MATDVKILVGLICTTILALAAVLAMTTTTVQLATCRAMCGPTGVKTFKFEKHGPNDSGCECK